jgi:hypothetical protein
MGTGRLRYISRNSRNSSTSRQKRNSPVLRRTLQVTNYDKTKAPKLDHYEDKDEYSNSFRGKNATPSSRNTTVYSFKNNGNNGNDRNYTTYSPVRTTAEGAKIFKNPQTESIVIGTPARRNNSSSPANRQHTNTPARNNRI